MKIEYQLTSRHSQILNFSKQLDNYLVLDRVLEIEDELSLPF